MVQLKQGEKLVSGWSVKGGTMLLTNFGSLFFLSENGTWSQMSIPDMEPIPGLATSGLMTAAQMNRASGKASVITHSQEETPDVVDATESADVISGNPLE